MTHGRNLLWTLAALLVLASACGDDDGDKGDAGSGSKGGDQDAATSGGGDKDASTSSGGGDKDAATSGGGGGGSTTPKDAGLLVGDEDAGIELCGSVTCAQPECCADPFVSMCGLQVNARACLPPQMTTAMSDSRCPNVEVMNGAFMIPSCCTDDNKCGINAQAAGMGCISLEEVIMYTMTNGGAGFGIDWPEPKACDE